MAIRHGSLALAGMVLVGCGFVGGSGQSRSEQVVSNGDAAPEGGSNPVQVPATTTTTAPTPTPTRATASTTEPRRALVIQAAGDVSLDPSYITDLAANGYPWALSGLDGLFEEDDLTLVNLECVPSDLGTRQDRPFNFRCDPAALGPLRDGGVEVVSLGNNHAMDYGPEAVVDGVANVEAVGLGVVGAGADREAAFAPLLIERNGWEIAVLGFGANYLDPSWLASDERPGISDGLDLDATTGAVREAASTADLVIVTVHWCCELETEPNARNRAHAEAWLEAGAGIVLGHHHHRLQPLELIDGRPVAWGLGNFVWPKLSAGGADTAVARIEVAADGAMTACLLPATIVSHGHPTLDDPATRTCGAG